MICKAIPCVGTFIYLKTFILKQNMKTFSNINRCWSASLPLNGGFKCRMTRLSPPLKNYSEQFSDNDRCLDNCRIGITSRTGTDSWILWSGTEDNRSYKCACHISDLTTEFRLEFCGFWTEWKVSLLSNIHWLFPTKAMSNSFLSFSAWVTELTCGIFEVSRKITKLGSSRGMVEWF